MSLEGERGAATAEVVEEKRGSIILRGVNEGGLLRVGGTQNGAGVTKPVDEGDVSPVSGWKVMPPFPAPAASVEGIATLGVSVVGVVTNGGGGERGSGEGDRGSDDGEGEGEGEGEGDGASSVKKMEADGAVRAADRATMIALGGSHSLVLTASGRVFAFGRQENGRLGVEVDAVRRSVCVCVCVCERLRAYHGGRGGGGRFVRIARAADIGMD